MVNFYQISQSKSKVVVFGDEPAHTDQAATMWHVQGMYNDDKGGVPGHTGGVEEHQCLGTWFHQNRKWETQFHKAAAKFWAGSADKWMETGAVRMGAGELVASKMWDAIAAPARTS